MAKKLSLKLAIEQIRRLTSQELLMFDELIGKEVCVRIPHTTGAAYFGTLSENGKDFIKLEDVSLSNDLYQPSSVRWEYKRTEPLADSILINKSSGIEYILDITPFKQEKV